MSTETNTKHDLLSNTRMSKSIRDVKDIFVVDTDTFHSSRGEVKRPSMDSPFMQYRESNNNINNNNHSQAPPPQPPSLPVQRTKTRVPLSLTRAPSLTREEIKVRSVRPPDSAAADNPDDQSTSSKHKWTRQEVLTICSLALGNLCLGTLYALLAPFFPHEV